MGELFQTQATVTRLDRVGPFHFVMGLRAPEIARSAQPGQFVNVRVQPVPVTWPENGTGKATGAFRLAGNGVVAAVGTGAQSCDPLLRRPFSIYKANAWQGEILLLGQTVGRGSQLLAAAQPGQVYSVLGPLGRPFWLEKGWRRLLLVGGGAGVAPLIFAGERWASQGYEVSVLFGYRSQAVLVGWDEVGRWARRRWLTTEDGSAGKRGFVTAWLDDEVQAADFEAVFSCGPEPLLARVAAWAAERGLPCQVSLERTMGCGLGVCLSCVCSRADGTYALTCTDGPVFAAQEVVIGNAR